MSEESKVTENVIEVIDLAKEIGIHHGEPP